MQVIAQPRNHEDGHLWMIAAGLSLCANLCLLALVGLASLKLETLRVKIPSDGSPTEEPPVATIIAEPAETAVAPPASTPPSRRFARTSPDQASSPADHPAFIGERNTRAVSDRTPVPGAPPLPSQAGITPRDETDIETTESDYQDGELAMETPATPQTEAVPATAMPENPAPAVQPESSAADNPPPREKLLDGPNPVDVQVPRERDPKDEIKPATAASASPAENPPAPSAEARENADDAGLPKPKTPDAPAFKGFQRKTAVVGSISRTGRSSLDVADSPLGRYQAAISRAVELEWQRNCVRHRDYITPGYLTVRFFVEPGGKVRSVQFVGDMETGEIQKGFTLNSIRDAAIPPMPATLRREYDQEPLELIFRFYF